MWSHLQRAGVVAWQRGQWLLSTSCRRRHVSMLARQKRNHMSLSQVKIKQIVVTSLACWRGSMAIDSGMLACAATTLPCQHARDATTCARLQSYHQMFGSNKMFWAISFQPWKYVHLSVVSALFIWVILFKCIGTKKKSANCEIPLDIFIYVATYSAIPIAHWAWLQGTVYVFGQ